METRAKQISRDDTNFHQVKTRESIRATAAYFTLLWVFFLFQNKKQGTTNGFFNHKIFEFFFRSPLHTGKRNFFYPPDEREMWQLRVENTQILSQNFYLWNTKLKRENKKIRVCVDNFLFFHNLVHCFVSFRFLFWRFSTFFPFIQPAQNFLRYFLYDLLCVDFF